MPISNSCAKELITKLRNAKVIHLVDNDYEVNMDEDGNVTYQEMEQWARVSFKVGSSSFYDLFKNFKNEFIHNKHITGFNAELYCNQAISNCESIKKHFETLNINGINVRVRNDVIFKHYKIGEVETRINNEGEPYDIHKPIILRSPPYEELKSDILTEISRYFTYQEKVLDIIMNFLRTGCEQMHIPRYYGSTYPYNYFKFKMAELGDEEEARQNIKDFFDELITKQYVGKDSLKSLIDYFNDSPSKSKVVWLKSKQELYYLISQLIVYGIICDPIREKSRLISKVFTNKDSSEFNPEEFHALHPPKYTANIDSIIGILK